MHESDIAALMKGVAPVIRDLVKPLTQRIDELQQQLQEAKAVDHSAVIADAVAKAVAEAVAALPEPEPAQPADPKEVERMVAQAVAALPPAKLPIAKAWSDEVHYEGQVRTHSGALWQAIKDTGREPGTDDWICLAAAGAEGRSADQIEVRGTYDPGKTYARLNIVALNGSAFIAKTDQPGDCPGEDWQVIAMRGKAGPPGPSVKGEPGKSIKGEPGDAVVAMHLDDNGLLTLTNGDGSTVECDFYPILSKVG